MLKNSRHGSGSCVIGAPGGRRRGARPRAPRGGHEASRGSRVPEGQGPQGMIESSYGAAAMRRGARVVAGRGLRRRGQRGGPAPGLRPRGRNSTKTADGRAVHVHRDLEVKPEIELEGLRGSRVHRAAFRSSRNEDVERARRGAAGGEGRAAAGEASGDRGRLRCARLRAARRRR